MPINSTQKGASFEREVANILRVAFDLGKDEVYRNYQDRGGAKKEGADVEFPGLWIEAKHRNRANVYKYYDQAKADSKGTGMMPVVIMRKTGKEILCTVSMGDFLKLLKASSWLECHVEISGVPGEESSPSEPQQSLGL